MTKDSNNKKTIVNIGTSLMVVILIGLSFAVIAALSVSSAKNSYDLAKKQADHTTDYYEAYNAIARQRIASGDPDTSYNQPMNDSQTLHVEVSGGYIYSIKVVNNESFEGEDSLMIHIEE